MKIEKRRRYQRDNTRLSVEENDLPDLEKLPHTLTEP